MAISFLGALEFFADDLREENFKITGEAIQAEIRILRSPKIPTKRPFRMAHGQRAEFPDFLLTRFEDSGKSLIRGK